MFVSMNNLHDLQLLVFAPKLPIIIDQIEINLEMLVEMCTSFLFSKGIAVRLFSLV